MTGANAGITLEEVLTLAEQLSPVDKVRLIERVALDVERALDTQRQRRSVSLLGLVKDLGPAPSEEEIDSARREAWASFPADDV